MLNADNEKRLRYGGDRTIHRTGEVNVELDCYGKVVAVWFRCMALPFDQTIVDATRAEEMRVMYAENRREMKIDVIELVEVKTI